jgi:hypothetical protein
MLRSKQQSRQRIQRAAALPCHPDLTVPLPRHRQGCRTGVREIPAIEDFLLVFRANFLRCPRSPGPLPIVATISLRACSASSSEAVVLRFNRAEARLASFGLAAGPMLCAFMSYPGHVWIWLVARVHPTPRKVDAVNARSAVPARVLAAARTNAASIPIMTAMPPNASGPRMDPLSGKSCAALVRAPTWLGGARLAISPSSTGR